MFTTAYIVDDYLTVSYAQNLLFARRPKFNTLSLSLSLRQKQRKMSLDKLKYKNVIRWKKEGESISFSLINLK